MSEIRDYLGEETFGAKMAPILRDIEIGMWAFEIHEGGKPEYPVEAIRSASKIFISVLMDKMFEYIEADKDLNEEDKLNMANKCGKDLRSMVKTYTGIDTQEFDHDFLAEYLE